MAEPLKNQFGPDVAEQIADDLSAASRRAGSPFDRSAFLARCLDGFDDLELGPRAQRIADAMADALPDDRTTAMEIVLDSLGPELDGSDEFGMATFAYWPHVKFVADQGQGDVETALRLQYELTKRFTAEFSIRAYLVGEHRDLTLDRLREWTDDPNEHVRRLVSEGTRPRLPWAPRLREFVDDPSPALALLERLRHDPAEYVRRSVANHLNDVAKDHPEIVIETCRRWWADADHDGRRMIRHALRTLVKAGDLDALDVLGFGPSSPAVVESSTITPDVAEIGGSVRVEMVIANPADEAAAALVDVRVHFVKANGSTSPKVFRGSELELPPGEVATVSKKVSVRQHSTRTHHPGTHRVEALINGTIVELGSFELRP